VFVPGTVNKHSRLLRTFINYNCNLFLLPTGRSHHRWNIRHWKTDCHRAGQARSQGQKI